MEKKERVLAFYSAKELTNEELTEISGGSLSMTSYGTQRGTGGYPGNLDYFVDVTADW